MTHSSQTGLSGPPSPLRVMVSCYRTQKELRMAWAFRVLFALILFPTLVINVVCQDKRPEAPLVYEDIQNGYRFEYPSRLRRSQDQGYGQLVNPATDDRFFMTS